MLSRSYKISYLRNEYGLPYGISMSAEYVSEHEQGVRVMHTAAGCGLDYLKPQTPESVAAGHGPEEADGIDRYRPQQARMKARTFFILTEGTMSGRVQGRRIQARYSELLFDADCAGLQPNDLLYNPDADFFGEYGPEGFRLAA